jgi:hypothetical protein
MLADSLGWPKAFAVACVIAGLGGLVWFLIDEEKGVRSRI